MTTDINIIVRSFQASAPLDGSGGSADLGAADTSVTQSFLHVGKRETLREEVLRQFVDLIRAGKLSPGDRLPAERDLASMMGISRPSVREALRALSFLGVTTTTQGRGTYLVESLAQLPMEPYLFKLLLNQAKLLELAEIRKIVEPEVAALAAKRADMDRQKDIVESFLAQEREVNYGRPSKAEAQAGLEFHYAIVRAAGNETLTLLLGSLSDLITEMGQLIVSRQPGASLAYHKSIMEAVTGGDSRRARHLMKLHLAEAEEQLRTALMQSKRGEPQAAEAMLEAPHDGHLPGLC